MRYLRLLYLFISTSFQEEAAYRANFLIGSLYSILNLSTGILGIVVLYDQVENVNGWDFASTLALLGVYLSVGAMRNMVIGPSLDLLAGMDGDVWSGKLDFTLIRPVSLQFLISLRRWRLFSILDLAFGIGVVGVAMRHLHQSLSLSHLAGFIIALFAAVLILYAVLLAFTSMVFWSPGVLFTWVFDGMFQMARYPLQLYPGWLRLVLTWIIPVGAITTIPAGMLNGMVGFDILVLFVALSLILLAAASTIFHYGVQHYKSASS